MRIDYDVGDVVVCVIPGVSIGVGQIGRVSGFRNGNGKSMLGECNLGVFLVGKQAKSRHGSYDARRFRKLPKADEEFTEYMRRMKPAKRKVDA